MKEKHFKDLGQMVMTAKIAELMEEDSIFNDFVDSCMNRYMNCDWGDLDKADAKMNNDAIKFGEQRIFASYNLPAEFLRGQRDNRIWIITEWDRSVTTILLPSEILYSTS